MIVKALKNFAKFIGYVLFACFYVMAQACMLIAVLVIVLWMMANMLILVFSDFLLVFGFVSLDQMFQWLLSVVRGIVGG